MTFASGGRRPVSIVVPVGSDLEGALQSIDSVIATVDLDHHLLFVINDAGENADAAEQEILERAARVRIRYFRNETRIGSVASLNLAVYEFDTSTNDVLALGPWVELGDATLDELRAVAAQSEKHALVAPRSNRSIMTAIPSRPRLIERPDSVERSRAVFDGVSAALPQFTIAPAVDEFCLFIRRIVIDNHGLFDAAFPILQHAVSDFSMRINRVGYSTVIANRAFATHNALPPTVVSTAAKSMAGRMVPRGDAVAGGLSKRYPYLPMALRDFERFSRGAIDRFADLLVPDAGVKKRVLVDLYHMSLNYDGSSRYALSFLDYLRDHAAKNDIDFYVSSSKEAIEFFHLKDFGFPTLADEDFVDVIFDLGIALCPATISANQLVRMNTFCLKWVISHLDVISLRSWDLRSIAWSRRVSVRDSFRYAEKVITISDFSVKDAFDYYASEIDGYRTKFASVLMGHSAQPLTSKTVGLVRTDLPADIQKTLAGDYVFVVGNGFPHKQVSQTLDALEGSDLKVVVLGSLAKGAYTTEGGHHSLPSGRLSETLMRELYGKARLIVFPSAYEGFGLPIAEAAHEGKRMVIFDTEVSREVVSVLEIEDVVTFFDNFGELEPIVRSAVDEAIAAGGDPEKRHVRDLSEYNAGLLEEILLLLASDAFDLEKLEARWDHFVSLPQYALTDEVFDEQDETEGIPTPSTVAVVGMPRVIGQGARATVHIGVEGPERKPLRGQIRIMDGETIIARKSLVEGEVSMPVPFRYGGKRKLSIVLRDADYTLQIGVVEVSVIPGRAVKVDKLPSSVAEGSRITVSLSVKPEKASETGVFRIRDGKDVLLEVPAIRGAGTGELLFAESGDRFLAAEYESRTDDGLVWGRSVLPITVLGKGARH